MTCVLAKGLHRVTHLGCGAARSGIVKLANIESGGRSAVALVVGEELIDLAAQLGAELDDVPKFLALGENGKTLAARCLRSATPRLSVSSVKFLAPVRCPDKILGVGMNYHSFTAAA